MGRKTTGVRKSSVLGFRGGGRSRGNQSRHRNREPELVHLSPPTTPTRGVASSTQASTNQNASSPSSSAGGSSAGPSTFSNHRDVSMEAEGEYDPTMGSGNEEHGDSDEDDEVNERCMTSSLKQNPSSNVNREASTPVLLQEYLEKLGACSNIQWNNFFHRKDNVYYCRLPVGKLEKEVCGAAIGARVASDCGGAKTSNLSRHISNKHKVFFAKLKRLKKESLEKSKASRQRPSPERTNNQPMITDYMPPKENYTMVKITEENLRRGEHLTGFRGSIIS